MGRRSNPGLQSGEQKGKEEQPWTSVQGRKGRTALDFSPGDAMERVGADPCVRPEE